MEKALEILTGLQQAKSYDENYPTNWEIQEAIAEINHFIDESESIRMLCDDRGGRITELEEAMKPKTCEWCKHYSKSKFFGDEKSTEYCHENKLGMRQINFSTFCCNKYEPKDNA